ncbi:WD repeat-containing protein 89-like [Homarus americanus]|uniref:WD repeat-containing protein 89-like n=1 Tax=Homarus americanus TaxID=6706 RepID=UPI001C4842DA|nr:WD repeat-containing protein 89-like [Homarus americanus]
MPHVDHSEENTCSEAEVATLFSVKYESVTSISLSEEEYCLHLTHTTNWEDVAVALSDFSVTLLKRETLQKVSSFDPHQECITGLKFSPGNNNCLWTSSSDGFVKMWDVRSNQCEKEFQGMTKSSSVTKPLTCFDISCNERILCAGTELVETGVFILFWDIRGDKALGSYWESHTDNITQVKFNPSQADTMATAATDGLINVFDISQSTEDDALTYCMNSEVTTGNLSWLGQNGRQERLSAITDIESLQYWDIKEAAPMHKYSREDVAAAMKLKEPDDCYLASVHMSSEGDNPLVLVGARNDEGSDTLCTLKLDLQTGQLKPHGSFVAKQLLLMIRAALYQVETDSYITAGECGVVRIWKPESTESIGKQSLVKLSKKNRTKPY